MKKYFILLFSTFILLVLGATYTYSVFLESFAQSFGVSKSLASIPFAIFLFSYAMGMGFAGKAYNKYPPRVLTICGGVAFSLGFVLSSFSGSIVQLAITYGVLSGFGLAFAYVTPITLVSEWFIEKKGLASGIVISAFGLGSFFLSPISNNLITKIGWRNTLRYEGIIFFIIILMSSLALTKKENKVVKHLEKKSEITVTSLFKNMIFLRIWGAYIFSLTTGLMIMGHIVPMAKEIGYNGSVVAIFISIIALANASGRIIIGALGDKMSGVKILKIINLSQAIVFILLLISYKVTIVLYLAVILFGFNFGGWLVLFPIVSSEYFGVKNLSVVYGILFSSYGVAGIVGPIFISFLQTVFGSYIFPLQISVVFCIMAFMILPGSKNNIVKTKS
ncbi:MFS transporter [Clostridium grantii]|uniref:MFS transporter, OFA family, oxalate/formate antiporter n=1 Tax=Clostridium grantii DSM 8605 TaxID=1121316 RepID=A0A1M5X1I2_9CLOT|nr:MFS transporter [Clostridium grantii]SHH93746.1 MFS transporter, OFA family, oxalate/formate antiporter [Clostridium grantii DSM 8605]